MTTGIDVVDAARQWVGTPFAHQGRTAGKGVDCAGVIACVGHDLSITDFDDRAYTMTPNPSRMKAVLDRELISVPLADARPGDILFCVHGGKKPTHVAIFAGDTLIHSTSGAGKCVEHRYDSAWRRRVRFAYRFPGVD